MSRRLLCLYFPCLAIDYLEREDPGRRLRPFAVTREVKGHFYIRAVNKPAAKAGIRSGIRLTDARAVLPALGAVRENLAEEASVKQCLLKWCGRYSPLVADDNCGGMVLDITGCAHLFGGEQALLNDIESRIKRAGYRVRGSIAGSLGTAWALARYGKWVIVTNREIPAALDPLPIEALRLPAEMSRELCRLGVDTIGSLRKIPPEALARRYGTGILLRLRQAFCQAEEPVTTFQTPVEYRARRMLPEPIQTLSAVEFVLLDLLKEICARLEKDHAGTRQLSLDCYRIDATVVSCRIGTSKPARSIKHLMRLFSERLNKLDAGFGIETLVLSAPNVNRLDPIQLGFPEFDDGMEGNTAMDGLIDRLGTRLGFQDVCRFQLFPSLLPEHAMEYQPVTATVSSSVAWPEYRIRPVYLIEPPVHIEVSLMFPDEAPVQFRLGQRIYRLVKIEGPERLTPEWWRDQSRWELRDYYRIEDEQGARFWIFKETKSAFPYPRWFLHGHLP